MAANLKEQLKEDVRLYLQQEDRLVPRLLGKMESSTGVSRENLLYGLMSLIGVYLVLGHGAELLCNFIGFAYPAYASFKAIETEDKADDTQWLTYWTVFGTISLVDFAADKIMGFFPFYWLAKCIFLLWLYLPIFRGAEHMHKAYLGPAFKRLRPAIDGTASEVQGRPTSRRDRADEPTSAARRRAASSDRKRATPAWKRASPADGKRSAMRKEEEECAMEMMTMMY